MQRGGSNIMTTRRRPVWLALLASTGMLGGALLFQYVGGLHPCEMCLWQRIPHGVIIALALLALRKPASERPILSLIIFGFLISSALGLLHMGVEQHWWQIETTCTASGTGDLSRILLAPVTRCDDIAWSLLGISMAGYNMLLSLLMAMILYLQLRRP
jgi:disulfide bond formation protein DsbB